MQRSIAISITTFRFVQVCSAYIRRGRVFGCCINIINVLKKRFVVFACDPAGGFFLKNHTFQILQIPTETLICSDLSIKSVLERLVLKNLTQRTSQRVKWTSGARVTIISCPSLDRSLDRSLGNRQKIGSQEKYRVAG